MENVKFGMAQKSNPTPSKIALAIDIFSGIAGGLTAWVASATFIPSTTSNIVVSILGLLTTLCQVLKPYFGVQTNKMKVDIDDVKEMDNVTN